MRYAADVIHMSARKADDDRFCVVPIEAGDIFDAARKVAEVAAARRYEEDGSVGFITPTTQAGWFRATIGEQRRSHDGIALHGVTISIHVWPVE